MKRGWGLMLGLLPSTLLAAEALSPQNLAELVHCTSFERYAVLQPALLDLALGQESNWIRKNSAASQLGVYSYDLDKPIKVFGQLTQRLVLHKEFVAVPLPATKSKAQWADALQLRRLPIKLTEQYYRFTEAGPMLSLYELGNPLALLLGVEETEPRQAYMGCSYNKMADEASLLAAAQLGDEMIQKAQESLLEMLQNRSTRPEE